MADITWTVEADFDRDGTYSTDLSPYIEEMGGPVQTRRGLGPDGVYRVGTMGLTLTNFDGAWTPANSASAVYGQVWPGVPIRLKATHNAIGYTLWTGFVRKFSHEWAKNGRRLTRVDCHDLAALLATYQPVNVTAAQRTTGAAMTAIAGAIAGLTGSDYSFDAGKVTLPVHWARNQTALRAFLDVVQSELGGLLWVDATGRIRFSDRSARLGITPDDTWGDGTSITPESITYEQNDDELVTAVTVEAQVLSTPDADVVMLFSRNAQNDTPDSLALASNEQWGPTLVDFSFPVWSITAPVSGTDYTANSAIDGSGTDRTANLVVTAVDQGAGVLLTLLNTYTATIYVTWLQIRGEPRAFVSDRPVFLASKANPNVKIGSGVNLQAPFASDAQVTRDWAMAAMRRHRYPWPRLTLSFEALNDAIKVAMLSVEIGDLVYYKDSALGVWGPQVDDWWRVESLVLSIPPGLDHKTFSAAVTLIPSYLYRNLDRCAYDAFDRANGALGTSTSGDAWVNASGMTIVSNKARPTSDSQQLPYLELGAGATDQVIEVNLESMAGNDLVGLIWRYQDTSNFYSCFFDVTAQELWLRKTVAGASSHLTGSPLSMTVGAAHELRVMMQGSRIRVWVDFVQVFDVTDTALTTGTKIGLIATNANGTTTFDDLYAEALN